MPPKESEGMKMQGCKYCEVEQKTYILARPLKHFMTNIDPHIRKWVEETMDMLEDNT